LAVILISPGKPVKQTCILPRWSHVFNSIIELNGLKDIKLLGRQFTWENNLPDPTYEKLDRVLVSIE
jgi:hypothetical protein